MQQKHFLALIASLFAILTLLFAMIYWADLREKADAEASQNSETEQSTPTLGETQANQSAETVPMEPDNAEFVCISDYIPDIVIDLKYATADNFTGQIIYDFDKPYLRYGTVKKLTQVQQELKAQGLRLKIWDAFRPPSAQFKLWNICPDPTYVSNPNNGFSSHSRGNTVDITLVYADGREVEMPTGFDDFSEKADRDYNDCTASAAENAIMLEEIMQMYGFRPYFGEWWHYTDATSYDVDMEFLQQ